MSDNHEIVPNATPWQRAVIHFALRESAAFLIKYGEEHPNATSEEKQAAFQTFLHELLAHDDQWLTQQIAFYGQRPPHPVLDVERPPLSSAEKTRLHYCQRLSSNDLPEHLR